VVWRSSKRNTERKRKLFNLNNILERSPKETFLFLWPVSNTIRHCELKRRQEGRVKQSPKLTFIHRFEDCFVLPIPIGIPRNDEPDFWGTSSF
ncbi:MAG TPA: hypothetical protein PKN99_11905, partial [Cyclobacteriaceae bacterium]|nr:hypothetical protein [Cyclobacteriaceae bacterium]